MTSDLQMMIEEEFADASCNGNVAIAKLYTELRMELDKQIEYHLNTQEIEEAAINEFN